MASKGNTDAASRPPEIEAAGLEEFLRLLGLRVGERGAERESLPRRAVCVAELYDARSTEYGVQSVRRYVEASFAWGGDLVRLELVSSRGYEHPDPREVQRLVEKHEALALRVREAVGDRLVELGRADQFPIVRGALRPAGERGSGRP